MSLTIPTAMSDMTARFAHYEMCDAMVGGNAHALAELLDSGYTLTHMTGYIQSRDEWVAEVAAGSMEYHSIADMSVEATRDGANTIVTARTMTDATIWGTRATWRLELRTTFRHGAEGAVALHTVASTW